MEFNRSSSVPHVLNTVGDATSARVSSRARCRRNSESETSRKDIENHLAELFKFTQTQAFGKDHTVASSVSDAPSFTQALDSVKSMATFNASTHDRSTTEKVGWGPRTATCLAPPEEGQSGRVAISIEAISSSALQVVAENPLACSSPQAFGPNLSVSPSAMSAAVSTPTTPPPAQPATSSSIQPETVSTLPAPVSSSKAPDLSAHSPTMLDKSTLDPTQVVAAVSPGATLETASEQSGPLKTSSLTIIDLDDVKSAGSSHASNMGTPKKSSTTIVQKSSLSTADPSRDTSPEIEVTGERKVTRSKGSSKPAIAGKPTARKIQKPALKTPARRATPNVNEKAVVESRKGGSRESFPTPPTNLISITAPTARAGTLAPAPKVREVYPNIDPQLFEGPAPYRISGHEEGMSVPLWKRAGNLPPPSQTPQQASHGSEAEQPAQGSKPALKPTPAKRGNQSMGDSTAKKIKLEPVVPNDASSARLSNNVPIDFFQHLPFGFSSSVSGRQA